MSRRVVVTGIGLVSPLGIGTEANWEALCAGRNGIGPITRFDASQYSARIAGEVKGFDPQAFIEKLERAGRRRVLMTINSPPQPSQHRILYEQVHGEPEEIAPGHQELLNVLWEMDILPDVQILPLPTITPSPVATREAAISGAMERLKNA